MFPVYSISDLHMGAGDSFDIFGGIGKDNMLIGFLRSLPENCTLVINGDMFDVLQIKPWVADVKINSSKYARVISAHQLVFSELNNFIKNGNRFLVIISGNHDPETSCENVMKCIKDSIPDSGNRILFIDESFSQDGVLYIHGHQADKENRCGNASLPGFKYPDGTMFVLDFVNEFKEKYKFVDLLYPEMPAVPLLIMSFEGIDIFLQMSDEAKRFMKPWILECLYNKQLWSGPDLETICGAEAIRSISWWPPGSNQPDVYQEYADFISKGSIKSVVMGHTHQSLVSRTKSGAVYVNSGAWCERIGLPETMNCKDVKEWLSSLRNNTFYRERKLTYTMSLFGVVNLMEWNGSKSFVIRSIKY